MSGLFRNYDKLICASLFSAPNKFILRGDRWRFTPASLYYNPAHRYTGLPQGHNLSAFALATISQSLVHEAKQFSALEKNEQIENEIQLNFSFSAQCAREALTLISSQAWSQEVETSVALLYSLANNGQLRDLNKGQLLDNIVRNGRYLSSQNIVDVVTSLQDYEDKQFWNDFFAAIKDKEFVWQYETIDYDGWHTHQFLKYTKAPQGCVSHTKAALEGFQGGQLGAVRKLVYDGLLFAWANVWLPFIQKETRVRYIFDERIPCRESLKSALKKIQSFGVDVDSVLKKC